MENFINDTIDITKLSKYEEIVFTPLHSKYKKVVYFNISIVIAILILIPFIVYYANDTEFTNRYWLIAGIITPLLSFIIIFLSFLGFKKKGYAFRNHDVLYRSGVMATNTIVIPYNRVQHVALHEGFISRFFGLASIEIYTAGGNSGDIQIPGIEKEQAENIKQLLMGKIQKQL
jgi:uncharacterized protein